MKAIVFGAGGHGKVVADALRAEGHEVIAFLDDAMRAGSVVAGAPVLSWNELERIAPSDVEVALAIGDNAARERAHRRLLARAFRVATVIHPRATVATSARVREGTFVGAGAVVNADAETGCGSIINTNAVVEHDCVVGPYAHVAQGAVLCGGARLGARVLVAALAVVSIGSEVADDERIPPGAIRSRS